MGLELGMVMGMVFGIALMAGWKYMMGHRSRKRVAKAVDVKLLSSLNREDMKKYVEKIVRSGYHFQFLSR